MNAAIDQQCEMYIQKEWFGARGESKKLRTMYKAKGQTQPPTYQWSLCRREMMVWEPDVIRALPATKCFCQRRFIKKLRNVHLNPGKGNSSGGYFKRRPGTEYLYFLSTEFALELNGRCAGIFHS
jgi:hypothetical protein